MQFDARYDDDDDDRLDLQYSRLHKVAFNLQCRLSIMIVIDQFSVSPK